MEILGRTLITLIEIIRILILAHIVLSWIRDMNATIWRLAEAVDTLVNPILRPFRNVVPAIDLGGLRLDISAFVVLILLGIARSIVGGIFF